jgi:hypothetical protein
MAGVGQPKARRALWIVYSVEVLFFLGLIPAVIAGFVTGGARRALLVFIGYICGYVVLFLPVYWLTALSSWRSSGRLWRERMTSGFYETLPPIKDDDD